MNDFYRGCATSSANSSLNICRQYAKVALHAIVAAVLIAVPTQADTTWTNAGIVKNFWDFGDNWSAGTPDAEDVVTFPYPFPGTGNIALLSPSFADSLVFNDGYRLTTSSLT